MRATAQIIKFKIIFLTREFLMIKKILISAITLLTVVACTPKEDVPDFKGFKDVKEKKAAFFNFMYPAVMNENIRVAEERVFLERISDKVAKSESLTSAETTRVGELAESYKSDLSDGGITSEWLSSLLVKVDLIPAPLVLSQGANESAWGTSRFSREASNYFGQWCYSKGCGLVPNQRNEGAAHEVAKFDSSQAAVHAYFMNVNRNNAYKELRVIRLELHKSTEPLTDEQQATVLAKGLIRYSERGEAYVEEIQTMIRHNSQYWR